MNGNIILAAALKVGLTFELPPTKLIAFAELIQALEREACAKVCEARVMGDNNREDEEAKRCAAAIRVRGRE